MSDFGKDLIKIVFGNVLLAAGYGCVTIPNKIVDGGATSFSLILSNIISIDVTILVNVLTLVLLTLSFWKLGKDNFLKTLLSSACYLVLLNVVRVREIQFIMHPLLVVMIASVAVGLGYYLCVSADASTAGFDTVAIIINRKNPEIEIGTTMRYISIFVLILGFASFGWRTVAYGIIFSVLETQTINIALRLEKRIKEFKIAKKEEQNIVSAQEVF